MDETKVSDGAPQNFLDEVFGGDDGAEANTRGFNPVDGVPLTDDDLEELDINSAWTPPSWTRDPLQVSRDALQVSRDALQLARDEMNETVRDRVTRAGFPVNRPVEDVEDEVLLVSEVVVVPDGGDTMSEAGNAAPSGSVGVPAGGAGEASVNNASESGNVGGTDDGASEANRVESQNASPAAKRVRKEKVVYVWY